MDIVKTLKEYEGTISYQQAKKIYRNGKFYPYQDSLGKWTIGYGRLIDGQQSKYTNGITEAQADAFLNADIATARSDASKLGVSLPADSNWNDFLVLMVFQLGLTKTRGFKKFLAALNAANYATACKEVRNSTWYQQTPNRIESMISNVING